MAPNDSREVVEASSSARACIRCGFHKPDQFFSHKMKECKPCRNAMHRFHKLRGQSHTQAQLWKKEPNACLAVVQQEARKWFNKEEGMEWQKWAELNQVVPPSWWGTEEPSQSGPEHHPSPVLDNPSCGMFQSDAFHTNRVQTPPPCVEPGYTRGAALHMRHLLKTSSQPQPDLNGDSSACRPEPALVDSLVSRPSPVNLSAPSVAYPGLAFSEDAHAAPIPLPIPSACALLPVVEESVAVPETRIRSRSPASTTRHLYTGPQSGAGTTQGGARANTSRGCDSASHSGRSDTHVPADNSSFAEKSDAKMASSSSSDEATLDAPEQRSLGSPSLPFRPGGGILRHKHARPPKPAAPPPALVQAGVQKQARRHRTGEGTSQSQTASEPASADVSSSAGAPPLAPAPLLAPTGTQNRARRQRTKRGTKQSQSGSEPVSTDVSTSGGVPSTASCPTLPSSMHTAGQRPLVNGDAAPLGRHSETPLPPQPVAPKKRGRPRKNLPPLQSNGVTKPLRNAVDLPRNEPKSKRGKAQHADHDRLQKVCSAPAMGMSVQTEMAEDKGAACNASGSGAVHVGPMASLSSCGEQAGPAVANDQQLAAIDRVSGIPGRSGSAALGRSNLQDCPLKRMDLSGEVSTEHDRDTGQSGGDADSQGLYPLSPPSPKEHNHRVATSKVAVSAPVIPSEDKKRRREETPEDQKPSKVAATSARHVKHSGVVKGKKVMCAEDLGWDEARFSRTDQLVKRNTIIYRQGDKVSECPPKGSTLIQMRQGLYTAHEVAEISQYFNCKCKVEGHTAVKNLRIRWITKSCHQCQYQHVYVPCECTASQCECQLEGTPQSATARPVKTLVNGRAKQGVSSKTGAVEAKLKPCSQSVCFHCIQTHYTNVANAYDPSSDKCPRCQGCCNCRYHLRFESKNVLAPAWAKTGLGSEEDRYQLNLGLTLPTLKMLTGEWMGEAKHEGFVNLESLKTVRRCVIEKGEKVNCDRCSTSICDVHRTCLHCNTQICCQCCAELRTQMVPSHEHGGVDSQVLLCRNRLCVKKPLVLRRLQPADVLHSVVQACRNENTIMSWLTPELAQHYTGQASLKQGFLSCHPGKLHFAAELTPEQQKEHAFSHILPGTAAVQAFPCDSGSDTLSEDTANALPALPACAEDLPAFLKEHMGDEGSRKYWFPAHDSELEAARASAIAEAPEGDTLTPEDWAKRMRLSAWKPSLREGRHHLLCVASDDLSGTTHSQAHMDEVNQNLKSRWQDGEPILVTGVTSAVPWEPKCMARVTHEKGNKSLNIDKGDDRISVQNCSTWTWEQMSSKQFFNAYARGSKESEKLAVKGKETLLKLKDFPEFASFSACLPRHCQDYKNSLPVPEMTRPDTSPHNLATMLGPDCNPTDLGPKCYIACGRAAQLQTGDSVTRVHKDLADAVNICLHQQGLNKPPDGLPSNANRRSHALEVHNPEHYDGAGAVWDIWRRKDLDTIRLFLREAKHLFLGLDGKPINLQSWEDPVQAQTFMFTDNLRRLLWLRHGVQGWHFEQNLAEAVIIPSGCVHQVRNLDSCIKVAVDFVSPQNMGICMTMAREQRLMRDVSIPVKYPTPGHEYSEDESGNTDSLQAEAILIFAVHHMVQTLQRSPRHRLENPHNEQSTSKGSPDSSETE